MCRGLAVLSFAIFASACGGHPSHDLALGKSDTTRTKEDAERWDVNDQPGTFGTNLEYAFASLPAEGSAERTPWASSYWPVYEDSINFRWDGAGSMSTSEKYGKAYNIAGVPDAVSTNHGIDGQKARKACTESSVCDSAQGETCSKREGATSGYCIPTWWGICHAWAPAAIMVPEPKYPVTVNGVTFKVNDIKALITLAHDKTSAKFVSLRCETSSTNPPLDGSGRTDPACRNTNPGTYHVLLANYLGKKREAFVEDRTWDNEVWNQPLRSYRILEQKEISATDANKQLGAPMTSGTTTKYKVTAPKGQWVVAAELAVTAGKNLKVTTTGTNDGDLYVSFGTAPTTSDNACSSTGSSSAEACDVTVPAGATKAFVSILGYSEAAAVVDVTVSSGGSVPTTYYFNPDAKKLLSLRTEVKYISEASSSTDGNLAATIDRYTGTDTYEYVLELDAAGKIIGGEWLNGSKLDHPDFLWLPTGLQRTTSAGGKITWANVKSLLDQSQVAPGGGGSTGVKTVKESFSLAKGAWKHYGPFSVAEGKALTATLSGTGDGDLYVRKGATPTTSLYDCRPYQSGSAEACTTASGPIFVSVFGYSDAALSIEITYEEGGQGPGTPPPATTHLYESGSVTLGQMKVYQVAVQAGRAITITTAAPNDVDLYVNLDSAPTTDSFLQRGYTPSGNERIRLTPASNGTLFVGVHGYAASAFTLTTAD